MWQSKGKLMKISVVCTTGSADTKCQLHNTHQTHSRNFLFLFILIMFVYTYTFICAKHQICAFVNTKSTLNDRVGGYGMSYLDCGTDRLKIPCVYGQLIASHTPEDLACGLGLRIKFCVCKTDQVCGRLSLCVWQTKPMIGQIRRLG